MPWFKVDDKHHDHKKTRRALRGATGKRRDAAAMGLWELAGSWCADNLTDGFVPTDELYRWDDDWETLSARLVAAGYWEPDEIEGESGFTFINWDEHQPVKAEVEAKREAARERMRNIRSGSRSRSSEVRANTTRSDDVRSPTPSRPDPSRPDPVVGDVAVEAPAATPPASKSRKKPSKPLADDWRPTEDHLARCRDIGVDPALELAKFRAHAEANDRRQVNRNAAFTQWLLNARPGNVRPLRPEPDDQGRILLPPLPRGVFEQ